MSVFIRTLIICLIICTGYYVYVFLGKESYKSELDINKTTVSKEVKQEPKKEITPEVKKLQVCFLTDENTTRFVTRETKEYTLENAINQLLKGPTPYEKERGIYSEIPPDVKLMWVKDENGKIIVNLTRSFEYGGGAKGIQNRIKQLKLTVDSFDFKKPVYLYLDGKQVEYMGGEGIYIEQPLN